MQEWFANWFDSPYYHILYDHRDESEAQRFIDHLIHELAAPQNARMLDLACGKGRHSIYLANKGFDVVGVDLSEQSIKHARQYEHEKLSFFTHDMRKLFRSHYFDYIFNFFTSFGYFSKSTDHNNTLSAIAKGLKKDGIFVMDFINAIRAENNLKAEETQVKSGIQFHIRRKVEQGTIIKQIQFEDQGHHYQYEERVRGFRRHELQQMLSAHGLSLISCFGDYDLNAFDEDNSPRLVLVAKRI